jgi:hypothetical protein
MGDALRTFTIDTANSPWVCIDGQTTTISGTSESFKLYLEDLGTTGKYIGRTGGTIELANGRKLTIEADPKFIELGVFEDGTAKADAGSLWVREDNTTSVEVKVVTATFTDADGTGNDNLSTITFEYPGKPFQWTWTNIKMA